MHSWLLVMRPGERPGRPCRRCCQPMKARWGTMSAFGAGQSVQSLFKQSLCSTEAYKVFIRSLHSVVMLINMINTLLADIKSLNNKSKINVWVYLTKMLNFQIISRQRTLTVKKRSCDSHIQSPWSHVWQNWLCKRPFFPDIIIVADFTDLRKKKMYSINCLLYSEPQKIKIPLKFSGK